MPEGATSTTTLCLGLTLCFSLGCGDEPRDRPEGARRRSAATSAVAATPESPQPPQEGAGAPCVLGDADRTAGLGTSTVPAATAIAVRGERGLVAVSVGPETLALVPIDGEGHARRETVRLHVGGAAGLFALLPMGERFVLLTTAPCTDGARAAHCLRAAALDPEGRALGRPVVVRLDEPLRTARRRSSDEALVIAHSHATAPPGVERFLLGVGGHLIHEHLSLGPNGTGEARPTEVLGLALQGRRWAVLWRRGALEDPTSEVLLRTEDGSEHATHALHHALVVESLELDGPTLSAIVGFEFSRPHLLRLGLDGEPSATPVELRAGQPVPDPFTARRSASLADDGRRLLLRLRDGAGDALGASLSIATHAPGQTPAADVTRIAGGFLVAWSTRTGEETLLWTRALACPDGSNVL